MSALLEREERVAAARVAMMPPVGTLPDGWASHVEECFRALRERRERNDARFPSARPFTMDMAHGEAIAAVLQAAACGDVPPPAECRRVLAWLLLELAEGRAAERRALERA